MPQKGKRERERERKIQINWYPFNTKQIHYFPYCIYTVYEYNIKWFQGGFIFFSFLRSAGYNSHNNFSANKTQKKENIYTITVDDDDDDPLSHSSHITMQFYFVRTEKKNKIKNKKQSERKIVRHNVIERRQRLWNNWLNSTHIVRDV